MKSSEDERCAEHRRFQMIDAAFRQGNLEALKEAVDDPDGVPNGPMPLSIGSCLEYAIYHSPLSFIRELLELGADPNPTNHAGFPPMIAALSCSRPHPGSPGRIDVLQILALLLKFGADVNQRGINDYTPLHMAVSERHGEAVGLLLDAGADRTLRTRIDDCETPLEMAQNAGMQDLARLLTEERGGTPTSMTFPVSSWLSLALLVATVAGAQSVPPALSRLLARANVNEPVAGWCAGAFRPGRTGAYAVAVTSTGGGGRYLVVESDAKVVELGGFVRSADVSCYTASEARRINDTIRQSETVQGNITPQYATTVVCAFVEDTSAVCWQYSPSKRAFEKVGGWVT